MGIDKEEKSSNVVLLPIDGSVTSFKALSFAKKIAEKLGLNIKIVHVSEKECECAETVKKLMMHKYKLAGYIIASKAGIPSEVILEESRQSKYIIMSTHGYTCDMSKLIGHTTLKILEEADIPVLLIRPNIEQFWLEQDWKLNKVLIPLNGTPGAAKALVPVIEMIAKSHAEIDLLHIATQGKEHPAEAGTFTSPYYVDYPQHEWPQWTQEFLKRFSSILEANHNNLNFNLSLSMGDPAQEILTFAKQNKYDLIAMAWHGKLGSLRAETLKTVVFNADCPVLLVRVP